MVGLQSDSHEPDDSLHLPRILCLHGGGVNGSIFQTQARALIKQLPDFRLVFANAPWLSEAGPGILPVYKDHGPFRRWLRWRPEHPVMDDDVAACLIKASLEACKRADPGTGAWVGILGFSQGAKIAASLLYDQQIREENGLPPETDYKFGVLLAGRGPLVSFCDASVHPALQMPGELSKMDFLYPGASPHILSLPTIHVHGLLDEGLFWHRRMLKQYHDPLTSTVIEWEGNHRVPLKRDEVGRVAVAIRRTARYQGVDVMQ